jgi:hypothetical protein
MLRAVLLALVVLGLLSWLLLTPRASGAGDFVQDLQAGNVESYQVGSSDDFEAFHGFTLSDSSGGDVLMWCTGQLDCHQLPIQDLTFLLDENVDPGDGTSVDEEGSFYEGQVVDQLVARYAAHNPPRERHDGMPLEQLGWVWPLVYLTMLFVLITGPQPRRATKWAVFWIFSLPSGLGLLWALTREAPWHREASELPEPAPGPGPGRWTGGWAFIAVGLLSPFLNELPAMVQSVLR